MKKTILVMLIMLLTGFVYAEKVATLAGIGKVASISLDDHQLYVLEGATIRIYSLKDYSLIKKIGKAGQGPQEFWIIPQLPLFLDVDTDKMVVGSIGKISYFKKDGTFISETRYSPQAGFFMMTMGGFDQFLGMRTKVDKNALFRQLSIYNSKVEIVKEILTIPHDYQGPGKGLQVLKNAFAYSFHDNKIFVSCKKDFVIDVYDKQGKKIYAIEKPYKKKKVTGEIKDRIIDYLKTSPSTRDQFEALKPIIFPDEFPAIAALLINSGKIYAMTYKEKESKEGKMLEFYILGLDGKLIEKKFIKIQYMSELETFPFRISNGKLYQLVENEDEEEWELHVHTILK